MPVGFILSDGGALRRGNVRHCSRRDELPELVLCGRLHGSGGAVLSCRFCEPWWRRLPGRIRVRHDGCACALVRAAPHAAAGVPCVCSCVLVLFGRVVAVTPLLATAWGCAQHDGRILVSCGVHFIGDDQVRRGVLRPLRLIHELLVRGNVHVHGRLVLSDRIVQFWCVRVHTREHGGTMICRV